MTLPHRTGQVADAPAIAELFARSFTDTFGHLYYDEDLAEFLAAKTADDFRRELADPSFRFFVAEEAGQITGFLKLGPPELPVETPPGGIEICQLYVDRAWHGSGVAAALMGSALAEARAQGARHIQLSVFIDNHRARRFYARYGFEEVGSYDFMVGSHADRDIVLRLLLGAKS